MTSGTTEYTSEQIMFKCLQHLQQVSKVFVSENDKIQRRIEKAGIAPAEFVKYCIEKEPAKHIQHETA